MNVSINVYECFSKRCKDSCSMSCNEASAGACMKGGETAKTRLQSDMAEQGAVRKRGRLANEPITRAHVSTLKLFTLLMPSCTLRGGTVGMPSKGWSMLATSSNTSACSAAWYRERKKTKIV